MATMSDITQGAYYRGDANLGGGTAVPMAVDLSPWQKLADFAHAKGKMLYEDKLARYKEASAEAAKSMQIDWSAIPEKYRNEITTQVESMKEFLTNNPNAADRMEAGDEVFFEFQDRYNKLSNLSKAGTQRGLEIKTAENLIATKALSKDGFDAAMKKFKEGLPDDIYQNINPFPEYGYKPIDIKGESVEMTDAEIEKNSVTTTTYNGWNFRPTQTKIPLVDTAPNYNEIKGRMDAAAAFNEVSLGTEEKPGFLREKGPDGKPKHVLLDKDGRFIGFTPEAKYDPQVGPLMEQIEAFNKDRQQFMAVNGVPAIGAINPLDGISEVELAAIFEWASVKNSIEKKETYTGAADALKRQRESDAAQKQMNRENNAARNTTETLPNENYFNKLKPGINPIGAAGMSSVELGILKAQFQSVNPDPMDPKYNWAQGVTIEKVGNGVYIRRPGANEVFVEASNYNQQANTEMYKRSAKGAEAGSSVGGGTTTSSSSSSTTNYDQYKR